MIMVFNIEFYNSILIFEKSNVNSSIITHTEKR